VIFDRGGSAMKSAILLIFLRSFHIGALFAATAVLGGCLQTTQTGGKVEQQQVWVARIIYSCANGSTLTVTRQPGSVSALVQVGGRSYQLPRDASTTGGEHYTTNLQTLDLQGNTASFTGVGLPRYEPCTTSLTPLMLDPPRGRGSRD
jgi:hypothetical protein